MKTFSKNQKVTHVEHGVGIVKKLRHNDTQGYIDFGGFGYWYRADNSVIKHGVNTYIPNTYTLDEIKQAIDMVKGETCNGAGNHSEGGRIALDQLIKTLTK